GIRLRNDDGYRRWIDLSSWEREKILSELQRIVIASGQGFDVAERLMGEVYHFPREAEGTELHEAKEFATLLNSCGRYEKASVGFALCKGDREESLDSALMLLKGHRGTLVDSLRVARSVGVERLEHIQYFHGGSKILDSVIGITAGMLLGSGEVENDIPLFAFANAEDGVKVSARGTRELVAKGLDLSHVMKVACERLEGVGGGHNIAAGATIPNGTEEEFLTLANELVGSQMEGLPVQDQTIASAV
ncbi:MAG: DHH family phosphoesterase, partial [Thermoplasmata archaeon]|nr:DHH family phosphoesterase [Thermoplasmata archaeon]